MMLKSANAGLFTLLATALLLPMGVSAQVISTSSASVANVPVDNPVALGLLLIVMAVAGWWSLRRSYGVRRVLSLLVVVALVGLAGQGAGIMAQVVSAFTNPAGETQPIAVSPITAGGFTGFQPADFSNGSGATLKITALVLPTFAQCFATNPANTLLPAGAPIPSPHPACSVGAVLLNGASCRVDVEANCRALYAASITLTAISPISGSASGGVGVTLTGTGLAGATSITFDGVAATSVNVINSTTVTAVTPAHAVGNVNVVITTPGGTAQLVNGYTYLVTAVGQSSSGGVIAALDGGLNNLIAAVANNSTSIEWGGFGTAVGAAAQSDTDGAVNSTAIQTTLGAGVYAAQLCSNYEVDSQGNSPCEAGNTCYADWFLPAADQLLAVYNNRVAVGGFNNSPYWSSTEANFSPASVAYAVVFSSGGRFGFAKTNTFPARCVRAFTP